MKYLFLLLVAVSTISAYKDEMLDSNRIPTNTDDVTLGDTCGECKSMVKRFIEAIDDPTKLAELKMLLSALCHETSYAEECKLIVSKIDVIIKKLEPYLRDAEAVCKKMHLCSNPKLTSFHRIGLLYLKHGMGKVDGKNDFICDECQLAAIELKKAVDDQNQRAAIKNFISENVCKHIPKYQGACDLMLEEFLPELWQELDALLASPKAACAQIGFCSSALGQSKFNKPATSPKQTLATFFKKSQHIQLKAGGQVLLSCFECKALVDALVFDLKQPETYNDLADDLRNWACPKMPEEWKDGCEDFLGMYGPTVVYMTVMQIEPEKLCTSFKACDTSSAVALKQMSKEEMESMKCDACKAFSAFMEYEIAQPDFKTDVIAGINNKVCSKLRDFSAFCENLSVSYVPKFVDRVVRLLKNNAVCAKIAHVC